jgi:hypothetical protein
MGATDVLRDAGLSLLGTALMPVPTSGKKRHRVMQAYRDGLDCYKPLVEERLSVEIPDIGVRDLDYMHTDLFYDGVSAALKSVSKSGNLTETDINNIVAADKAFYLIGRPFSWLRDGLRARGAYFVPGKNTLYVSFAPLMRVHDFNIGSRLSNVPQDAIQALSTAAWFALGGKADELDDMTILGDYAEYCAKDYMSHLYGSKGEYCGENAVRELVEIYGGASMRDIPSQWKKMATVAVSRM